MAKDRQKGGITVRLPVLQATNQQLFDIYTNKMCLTAKEICNIFDVCPASAYRVIKMSNEFMSEEQRLIIYSRKIIPVDILFKMYSWDIKKIATKAKMRI